MIMIMYFITVFRLFTVHMVHFYFLLLAIRKLLIFLDFSAVFFLTLLFLFLTSFLGVLHLGLGREGFFSSGYYSGYLAICLGTCCHRGILVCCITLFLLSILIFHVFLGVFFELWANQIS